MKYRVITSSEGIEDFKTKPEADIILKQKKLELRRAKIIEGVIPSCTIHECGHDEGIPCVNWERFEKE